LSRAAPMARGPSASTAVRQSRRSGRVGRAFRLPRHLHLTSSGGARPTAPVLWSACDLSPLWFGAKRRWGNRIESPSALSRSFLHGRRGSAANQSGDKSPHSTRRRPAISPTNPTQSNGSDWFSARVISSNCSPSRGLK